MNGNSIVKTAIWTVLTTMIVVSRDSSAHPQYVLNIDKPVAFWGTASVSGQKEHLKQFDAKLKSVLGFSNLEEYEMGCVIGCDKFSTPDPLKTIVYVFPRDDSAFLSKFGEAWDQIQQGVMDPGFKLEIAPYVIAGDCNPVTEPPPCQDMPFCAGDGCGKKRANGTPNCGAC
jgi:hypothetical protein